MHCGSVFCLRVLEGQNCCRELAIEHVKNHNERHLQTLNKVACILLFDGV
jgi:hypothetical protein